MIGYLIEQELGNLLPAEVPFATILTMIEVDAERPGVRRSDEVRRARSTTMTRPNRLAAEKGWVFKRDGDHLRRVVALAASRSGSSRSDRSGGCSSTACVVICAGGGGIPTDLGAGRGAHARRRRGRHRQGPRQRAAGPRDRRRPVRHGHRRRRRVRGLGHAGAAPARPGHARGAARRGLRRRVDGPEGRRRGAVRRGDRASGPPSARSPTSSRSSTGTAGTNVVAADDARRRRR